MWWERTLGMAVIPAFDYALTRAALEEFGAGGKELSAVLEQVLKDTAKIGSTCFQWGLLKPIIIAKFSEVSQHLQQGSQDCNDFGEHSKRIVSALTSSAEPPFTLQRMCELLVDPHKHYSSCKKFMAAFEKVTRVTSIQPVIEVSQYLQQRQLVYSSSNNGDSSSMSVEKQTGPNPNTGVDQMDVDMK